MDAEPALRIGRTHRKHTARHSLGPCPDLTWAKAHCRSGGKVYGCRHLGGRQMEPLNSKRPLPPARLRKKLPFAACGALLAVVPLLLVLLTLGHSPIPAGPVGPHITAAAGPGHHAILTSQIDVHLSARSDTGPDHIPFLPDVPFELSPACGSNLSPSKLAPDGPRSRTSSYFACGPPLLA